MQAGGAIQLRPCLAVSHCLLVCAPGVGGIPLGLPLQVWGRACVVIVMMRRLPSTQSYHYQSLTNAAARSTQDTSVTSRARTMEPRRPRGAGALPPPPRRLRAGAILKERLLIGCVSMCERKA